jgi:hypothetical protein
MIAVMNRTRARERQFSHIDSTTLISRHIESAQVNRATSAFDMSARNVGAGRANGTRNFAAAVLAM